VNQGRYFASKYCAGPRSRIFLSLLGDGARLLDTNLACTGGGPLSFSRIAAPRVCLLVIMTGPKRGVPAVAFRGRGYKSGRSFNER